MPQHAETVTDDPETTTRLSRWGGGHARPEGGARLVAHHAGGMGMAGLVGGWWAGMGMAKAWD